MKRKALSRRKRKIPKPSSSRGTRKEASPREATRSPLGENIKAARTKANMTQLALAHAIGYTGDDAGAYVSRVESGQQAPRIDTLSRIADALGVPVCSLLPGK